MQWWRLKKRIHVSWQIALLCFGIVLGIFLVPIVGSYFATIVWLLVGVGLAAFCFWRGKVYSLPLLLLAGLLLGFWRGGAVQVELSPYAKLVGHAVTIEGQIGEDVERSQKQGTVIRLNVQKIDGHELSGVVWVTTSEAKALKRSDLIVVKGKLAAGFGGYVASMYRGTVTSIKRPVPGDVALAVRDWFAEQVAKVVASPEAALGLGFLTGQRQVLPAELDEAMKMAGLTHIVVASGYNLTILVRLARRLFAKTSKYLAALSSVTLIGSFIAITGMSPSMSRAGLVAGLSLAAWYYGRKFHPLVLLPFVAAVTVLINPMYGWNDLGWQLSFAAFAGVMILAPLLQAYFFGRTRPGILRQVVGETVAAQIATLPILVGAFGQFSNVALFANVLIVPLVPLAMLLVFLAGVLASILPPVAGIIGNVANMLLGYMIHVTQFFAGLPWARTELALAGYGVLICYGVIAGICVYFWRATHYDLRSSNIVE